MLDLFLEAVWSGTGSNLPFLLQTVDRPTVFSIPRLTASILFSARISQKLAIQAARAVYERGLTTPEAVIKTTWSERADLLKENGYRRYGMLALSDIELQLWARADFPASR